MSCPVDLVTKQRSIAPETKVLPAGFKISQEAHVPYAIFELCLICHNKTWKSIVKSQTPILGTTGIRDAED